jgi:hypothetical protein
VSLINCFDSMDQLIFFHRRQDLVGVLVTRICDEGAVDRLMSFNFAGLADEAEEALAFKARNANPREQPQYSRMLYTWYTSRGDYRNGTSQLHCHMFFEA